MSVSDELQVTSPFAGDKRPLIRRPFAICAYGDSYLVASEKMHCLGSVSRTVCKLSLHAVPISSLTKLANACGLAVCRATRPFGHGDIAFEWSDSRGRCRIYY